MQVVWGCQRATWKREGLMCGPSTTRDLTWAGHWAGLMLDTHKSNKRASPLYFLCTDDECRVSAEANFSAAIKHDGLQPP
eukprot:1128002-Pelagomonas_calceolata.AAC.2